MTVNINYPIERIAAIVKGRLVQNAPAATLRYLLLDSRRLSFPEHTIFFSLHPDPLKGKMLVRDLYSKGVTNFVVDKAFDPEDALPVNYIMVGDTLEALQALAAFHRQQYGGITKHPFTVIGITGSNGKTIVKEWLNQLLESDFNIARSPKSYNSQVGVPLSVLQIGPAHTLGIFEAGISQKGEMEKLEKMIRPDIGVFTNAGAAHDEGFESMAEKINEKLKLFSHAAVLIYCSDNHELSSAIKAAIQINPAARLQLFTWSRHTAASLTIVEIKKTEQHSLIRGIYLEKELAITIPFTDDASVENAITCWCVLLQMNVPDVVIAERMLHLFAIEMRLELKKGINNCAIINDSYSADINSLSIALDFLAQQPQHPKRTVILSDILQSGKSGRELYEEIAAILEQKHIHRLIGIGGQISAARQQFAFVKECHFFESTEDFLKAFSSLHFNNETILIKGARVFKFERINQLLEQKIHQTILSIDLNAIAHNLKEYQRLLKPGTKIMAMVKAFSYGSGSFEVASLLQFHKADYLGVAYADEGVELRKAGITLPIMVMNPDENTFNTLVDYALEPEIFSFGMLEALERYLLSSAIDYFPIHIKLDTGMHRLGFEAQSVSRLAQNLDNSKRVKVQSVFSHLVASEDAAEDEFTRQQLSSFLHSYKLLRDAVGYDFLRHISNTSGISRHPGLQLDMVRLGIGLYGIDNNALMQPRLKNVTTLTSTVSQVKQVKKGDSVGYGRASKVAKDTTVATVRIGYADGYLRRLSNGKGKMLLKNQLVPVIGNVCMDMTMLDISGVEGVEEGDEVIVFGEELPLQTLAKRSNSIPYEIMTGISQRVKRVYFQE